MCPLLSSTESATTNGNHDLRGASKFKVPPINLRSLTPEKDEIRTLPELLEWNARENPDHLFCVQAEKKRQIGESNDPYELTSITNDDFKRAVGRCVRWLEGNVPGLKDLGSPDGDAEKVTGKPPAVALLMESDVGILIHLFALMSIGVPVSDHTLSYVGSRYGYAYG